MGLFNKSAAPANNTQASAKKKTSELAKTLDESVWASAESDFKQNKSFVITEGNESKYLALLFDTTQIGGLAGKSARKDESKGSVLEAIRTGRIKTYLRIEMLCDDCILIIPDKETVENMDEFNLFRGVDYVICLVDSNGLVTAMTDGDADDAPEMVVTFNEIKDVVMNEKGGDALIKMARAGAAYTGGNLSEPKSSEPSADELFNNGGSDDDAEELPDEAEDLPDDFDDGDIEDINDAEELPEDLGGDGSDDFADLEPTAQDAAPSSVGSSMTAQSNANMMSESDVLGYDDSPVEEGESVTYYDAVTPDMIEEFVAHKFYSDDLGLEVSTEPFDLQFMHGNPYIPFNENRGEGWLNEYLSNFSRDANTRMERLHNENICRLRDTYLRIIRKNCESIAQRLDFQDESSSYGRIRAAIERNRNDNEAALPEIIAERREELEKSWYSELERVGDTAAMVARQSYEEDHRQQHDAAILAIDHDARDEIEREYRNGLRRANEDRRREAGKLLDLAVGEALVEVSKLYEQSLAAEQKEYLRLQNEMTRFIDANRKDEKVRIEVLAEENRQVRRANEVRKEFTAKIKVMAAEFDMKKTMLQADIDRMNREHDEELRNYELEWESRVQDQKDRAAELEARIDELLQQYAELDEKKTKEFADRMEALKVENEMKDANIEHIVTTHKRSNLISIFLVVAILIASIGIGFMIGSLANIRNSSMIEQDVIYQQYQDEMNKPSNNTAKQTAAPEENAVESSAE